MSQKYIHEVFEEICNIESREERIARLKENASFEVKTILQLCYNDKIVLDLPKGKPPFEECPDGREPTALRNAVKPLANCVVGSKVDRIRKEKFFINILESIHPDDAAILCAAKDGTITNLQNKKYRKITKALIEAALPELLS